MVTISERAKSIHVLMEEKEKLNEQANELNAKMERLIEEHFIQLKKVSAEQEINLKKIIAIDETIEAILRGQSGC